MIKPPVTLALFINGILLVMYFILKRNGEKGSFYWAPIVNPIMLFRLAKRTKNIGLKLVYLVMVFSIPILVVLFVKAAYKEMSHLVN
jgi:hypothetical protein